jgi:hypothetical protein
MKRKQAGNTAPLIAKEMNCSYDHLIRLIRRLPVVQQDDQILPNELIHKIARYFVVIPVQHKQVTAVRASSTVGRFPLGAVLEDDDSTWWISAMGSMPQGKGSEYMEFQLSPVVRRLSAVSIKIPPLPVGPLSVRTFRIAIPDSTSSAVSSHLQPSTTSWIHATDELTVENKTGYQRFELALGIDARSIRIVCTMNQISRFLGQNNEAAEDENNNNNNNGVNQFDAVGFYSIKFE